MVVVAHDSTRSQTATEIGHKLLARSVGHSVQHEHQRQASPGGGAQYAPRNRVGVSLGTRHKDAKVGHSQQLLGYVAVNLLDGINVGSVDEGQPLQHWIKHRHHIYAPPTLGAVPGQEISRYRSALR